MANVGAFDPFAGLFAAEQLTYGVPITVDASFIRVPIRNENLQFVKRPGPIDREYGTEGTLQNLHFLGSFVQGSIEVYPRYDSKFFHWLLAHAMGDESVLANVWVNGVAADLASMTSAYKQNTNISNGLTLRRLLAGQSSTGHYDEVDSWVPIGWTLTIPGDGSRPYFTFPGLGAGVTPKDSTSWASPPLVTGVERVKPSDYDLNTRVNAHFKVGQVDASSLTDWKFKTITIEYGRAIELNDPYTSHPSEVLKPIKTQKNNVTVRIELDLEQILPTAGNDDWHPKYMFRTETEGCLDLVMEGTTQVGAGANYAMRVSLPRVKFRAVGDPMNQPIIPQTVEGQVLGATSIVSRTGIDEGSVLGFGTDSDARVFVHCGNQDQGRSADDTWTLQLPSST